MTPSRILTFATFLLCLAALPHPAAFAKDKKPTLERVVILMRHGIKRPNNDPPLPRELTDQAWPVWILVTSSVAVWYAIDTALSLATGFGLNAIPNTIFLAAFLLPIVCSGVLKTPSREEAASPGPAW